MFLHLSVILFTLGMRGRECVAGGGHMWQGEGMHGRGMRGERGVMYAEEACVAGGTHEKGSMCWRS